MKTKSNSSAVSMLFDEAAKRYDAERKKYINCFDEFYKVAIEQIPFEREDSFTVLDLGAGTGLLSAFVLKEFPNAKITLTDISNEMLLQAQERFGKHPSIEYLHHNYITDDINLIGEYNVIISALSLHHSSESELINVFYKIYDALTENGIFINADQILGRTEEVESVYESTWLKQAKDNGCTYKEIDTALKRMKLDKTLPLSKQLELLDEAGFKMVNCWYQYYRYAVYSGQKICSI